MTTGGAWSVSVQRLRSAGVSSRWSNQTCSWIFLLMRYSRYSCHSFDMEWREHMASGERMDRASKKKMVPVMVARMEWKYIEVFALKYRCLSTRKEGLI